MARSVTAGVREIRRTSNSDEGLHLVLRDMGASIGIMIRSETGCASAVFLNADEFAELIDEMRDMLAEMKR
jgi:hypothetical protein